jgi:folate-binding protein YgfZ
MTAELLQQITTHGAAVNLSSRAKFQLTGADRVRYLNGQVTNDVRRVRADEILYACVTDVKGRIAGDVCVHAQGEALLLDAEAGLREGLAIRLERYIVADDVELTDVTEEWQLWHVFGGTADTPACPESGGNSGQEHSLRATRWNIAGVDVWLPAGAAFAPDCAVLTEAELETWRILQETPRWPQELNAETFPPEAGLESRAMDFAKGCYIGQEVLSRIKTTGKMPREMIAFETSEVVNAGDELWREKAVGKITSTTLHPVTALTHGLAMIRQGTARDGLHIGGSAGPLLARRAMEPLTE